VVASCPSELYDFLLEQFDLPDVALYKVNGPVNLVRLNQLIDQADGDGAALPALRPALARSRSAARAVGVRAAAQGDVLLHHPFESFEPVVQFLREAVHDPDVLAIKQTIYRTGTSRVLMDLLIEAARRGKEVLVVVELKARFDEEANINWAERLEAVGAQVVYGIVGLKTHAKLLLVTRREGTRICAATCTCPPATTTRARRGCTPTSACSLPTRPDGRRRRGVPATGQPGACQAAAHLVTAPFQLHRGCCATWPGGRGRAQGPAGAHRREDQRADRPGADPGAAAASQAGARIDLIVRGACMLPPGLPGRSDNIRVRSVVGRFLEHSRICTSAGGRATRTRCCTSAAPTG
jgi:polyphosphate kinase